MNKKLTAAVLCVAIGVVMLVTTAFASMSGETGYEAYKTSVKNMMEVKNLTGNIHVSLTDNGKELAKIDSKIKADKSSEEKVSSSTVIKTGTVENGFDLFFQNGKTVLKAADSDVYNVIESDSKNHYENNGMDRNNPEAIKAGEMVIDAFVGNLKNYFTISNKADGVKQVNVQLSDSQIPTVVNALISLAVKDSDMKEVKMHENNLPFGKDLDVKLPKLTEDVRIDSINFIADLSKDNMIQNQIINLTMSGKDAEGVKHTLKLDMNISLSDLNSTIPENVDLSGKNVKVLDKAEFENIK